MSWIRSAVTKAVEVGGSGGGKLTRTVLNYADSVVQQAGHAVAAAKLLQDRIAARNYQSFKQTVKSLEEVSVSCRGNERVQLLRRWLVALKEVERLSGNSAEINGKTSELPHLPGDLNDSPKKPTLTLYYDPDLGREPMYFRDVFLYSRALEGMTLSMILEAPNDEEATLLLEIYRMCLTGENDVHNVILRSIQDLAKAFSIYDEEVLAKREELLEYAQIAIAGLKVNAEMARIDSEVSYIHQNLDRTRHKTPISKSTEKLSAATDAKAEVLEDSVEHVQLCSRLNALLLKKKFSNCGDSPEIHAKKINKLKLLYESLSSSASKAEKRISEHRFQKEEAVNFRVNRTIEVSQLEKDLRAEIHDLEKQREELETELKKVNDSLAGAYARLHNAREEREQFDEASNEILVHLKTKEDELQKSISSYRAEASACNAFFNFLEATWVFQSSYMERKEKQINDELKTHGEYFVNLAIQILSAYKDELGPLIANFRKLVDNLKSYGKVADVEDEKMAGTNSRKNLEQEYVDAEAKLEKAFSIVESIKNEFCHEREEVSRKDSELVKELCDAIEKSKDEFKSLERPALSIEIPNLKSETPPKGTPQKRPSNSFTLLSSDILKSPKGLNSLFETSKHRSDAPAEESPGSQTSLTLKQNGAKLGNDQQVPSRPPAIGEKSLDPDEELLVLLDLEFEKQSIAHLKEIGEWNSVNSTN